MKFIRNHKKMAVSSLALVVALMAGGAAYAYFTTTGTGTGSANVGSGSTVAINQLDGNTQGSYSSISSPSTPDTWGLSYGGTSTTDFGNKINLVDATSPLSNVVVELDSQACQNETGGNPDTCTTTPGATFASNPITLTIYNTSGTILATDTETFNIPYRPSAADVNDPTQCQSGTNWAGYTNGGTQWYDALTSQCYYGIKYTAVFSNFTFTNGPVLPSTVIYGIAYDATSGPTSSLNVEESNEPKDISVGSDADPGNVYLASTGAAQGSTGEITCSSATAFGEYPTAAGGAGGNSCGAQVPQENGQVVDIPQVAFNTASAGYVNLLPGGAAQPVDFSVGNSGSGPAYVQTVTFAISNEGALEGHSCNPSWFSLVQPTSPLDVSIPAGTTVDFEPSGGSISLINEPYAQNGCEGVTVDLTFTANGA
jgi:hypothetical protein